MRRPRGRKALLFLASCSPLFFRGDEFITRRDAEALVAPRNRRGSSLLINGDGIVEDHTKSWSAANLADTLAAGRIGATAQIIRSRACRRRPCSARAPMAHHSNSASTIPGGFHYLIRPENARSLVPQSRRPCTPYLISTLAKPRRRHLFPSLAANGGCRNARRPRILATITTRTRRTRPST